MPWSGAGTYSLPPAFSPEVNGTTIDATRYNGLTTDVATAITACLAKNGENAATGNLPMGGFRHTGAAAASASGHYLVYGQSDMAVGLGTAALPGLTFISDPNTGWWSPGADIQAWSTAGVERLRLGSTGILTPGADNTQDFGSTSLQWKDVYATGLLRTSAGALTLSSSNAAGTLDLRTAGTSRLTVSATGGVAINAPSAGNALTLNQTAGAALQITAGTGTATVYNRISNTGGNAFFGLDSSVGGSLLPGAIYALCMLTESARDIYFGTNNTTRMIIGSGGNITLAAPTSGVGLTQTGFAGSDTAIFFGGTSGSFRITERGLPYGTSIHNNSGSVTGTTNQYIASGTYVPTVANVTNVAAISVSTNVKWVRVGNVVTLSGTLNIDPTAASLTTASISLPIPSNFATANNGHGTANGSLNATSPGVIFTDSVADDLRIQFTPTSASADDWRFTAQYEVI